jgi:nucleotide-binding universal stress UspA family protein
MTEATMKNVLVLMHDDAGQEARFQAAVDLTRALDGHLSCVDVAAPPVVVLDYPALGGAAMVLEDERESEAMNRSRMEARLRAENLRYDWVETVGFISPSIRDAAALSDLIVLNRDIKNSYPDMEEVAGELIIKAGRPIVAVPAEAKGFDAYGPALVAWDGSAEAEKALRAAVALLRLASKVVIVEVDDGSIQWPATAAAIYLSRHGVKAEVKRIPASMGIPSTIMLDQIEAHRAAYLVMGGFGHSRFVEATLGGFTRRMLHESPVPLLLAH